MILTNIWPFSFDYDRLAELFNSILATLISAIIIFLFIYFNRKKPIFKIKDQDFYIGRAGVTQLISDPIIYSCSISFTIINDSIYTAYNFKINSIYPVINETTSFQIDFGNIKANEEQRLKFMSTFNIPKSEVMKGHEETWKLDNEFITGLTQKYKISFRVNVSYRNDDNRKINKNLYVDFITGNNIKVTIE